MTVEDFKSVISEIANVPLKEIEDQSSFKDDLDVDSLQMVNLILEVSTKFGIELNKINSNDDLATVENMYTTFMGS
jgi:acyl carrier protein